MKCDFSGYATKNDLLCSDGRTIKKDAFADDNGKTVPLVWQHDHNDPSNVLGQVKLENRSDGVYAYGIFNDTQAAADARKLVEHGDINAMSIYANHVKQDASGNVMHGQIKEVSLVLSGANPGATIDNVVIHHADDEYTELDDEAVIYTDETICHSDGSYGLTQKAFDSLSDEDKEKIMKIINSTDESEDEEKIEHACSDGASTKKKKKKTLAHAMNPDEETPDPEDMVDDEEDDSDETIGDIIDTMNEKQKEAVYALLGLAAENGQNVKQSDDEGDNIMHNAFENTGTENTTADEFLHSDEVTAVFKDAAHGGTLSESVIAHAQSYGIKNIDILFPDAQAIRNTPDFYKRRTEWVNTVLNGTNHVPFSRIKSMVADITADEARAKGYTLDRDNNKRKLDEVFSVLKRTTTPQTIYKKQRLDRDDIIDITSFDVVAWMKQEMRVMLDEEIARAIFVGDGRSAMAEDKISEDHIRPIVKDDPLYTLKTVIDADGTTSDLIDSVTTALVDYEGSGSPTFFASPATVAKMLVDRDQINHRQYSNRGELASALGVSNIVDVPVFKGVTDDSKNVLLGVIINLRDYTIGADKGGNVSMFDDFDLDYNQQKYLIETRASGALTLPHSAIAVWQKPADASSGTGSSLNTGTDSSH